MIPEEEFIIVGALGPIYSETRFVAWPRHMTIVPWFIIDGGTKEALAVMQKVALVVSKFTIEIGKSDMFGSHRDKPVYLIHPTEALQTLHQLLVRELESANAVIAATYYIEDKFRPHITKKKSFTLHEGEKFLINSLYLVKVKVGEDQRTRLKQLVGEVELT